MSTPDIDCSRRRPPQALIHTPHSPSLQRGEEREGSRLAGQPFRGSDFPFPNSNLRQVAHVLRPSRCGEGGHAGGLEGPKPPGATCPPIGPRWRTCSSPTSVARGAGQVAWRGRSHLEPPAQAQVAHVLQPSSCGEGGHAGGLEGPKPPVATCPGPGGARAPALQVWRGGRGRWLGGGRSHLAPPERSHGHRRRLESTPDAFCTVLPMATGGVSHLLQVLFALFCPCPQAA